MKRLALLAVAGMLSACATNSLEQAWSETGHPMPDAWCHDYYNMSVPPAPRLYIYFNEPHAGRLLFPDGGQVVEGTMSQQGTTKVWSWDDGGNPMAFKVTNRWEGYMDDGSNKAKLKQHGVRTPEYKCIPYLKN